MQSQNILNKLVKLFFNIMIINKLYHWNTDYYSRHKATDNFNDKFTELTDKFVETYIGRYKVKIDIGSIKLEKSYITDDGIIQLFNDSKYYLQKLDNIIKDTDLLNIRDEILGEINQTLYLFDLK